jgi:hypothetical protein
MIVGKPAERRGYDKDPDLMSKSQFMSLSRKKCTMPYYYRYELGIEYTNDLAEKGTHIHSLVEETFDNFKNYPFRVGVDKLEDWLPEHDKYYVPYMNNFMRIYCRMTGGKFNITPTYQEVVARRYHEIGTLDSVWDLECGARAVIDTKSGKFKDNLANIRIETAFYARLIDAEYIGALFLGESEKYPQGGFFFEKVSPRLWKSLDEHIQKAWEIRKTGAFERVPTPLCKWCDYKKECRADCSKSEWRKVKKMEKML